MNFEVAQEFEKALKRLNKKYPSLKADFIAFLEELKKNPLMGDEIFPNCRKARIAIKSKGKGKSGGGRVIFYFEVVDDKIILLFIYDKSEMENVQTAFVEQILKNLLINTDNTVPQAVTGIEKAFDDIEKGRVSFVNGPKK